MYWGGGKRFLVGKSFAKQPLGRPRKNGKMKLIWIVGKSVVKVVRLWDWLGGFVVRALVLVVLNTQIPLWR